MSAKVFVDTHILVYRRDSTEAEKQLKARDCLLQLWPIKPIESVLKF